MFRVETFVTFITVTFDPVAYKADKGFSKVPIFEKVAAVVKLPYVSKVGLTVVV
jgi:hypothetical protein